MRFTTASRRAGHRGVVDDGLARQGQPEVLRVADALDERRRLEQRLGRDAAPMEARAADLVLVDEGHLAARAAPHGRPRCSRRCPRRARRDRSRWRSRRPWVRKPRGARRAAAAHGRRGIERAGGSSRPMVRAGSESPATERAGGEFAVRARTVSADFGASACRIVATRQRSAHTLLPLSESRTRQIPMALGGRPGLPRRPTGLPLVPAAGCRPPLQHHDWRTHAHLDPTAVDAVKSLRAPARPFPECPGIGRRSGATQEVGSHRRAERTDHGDPSPPPAGSPRPTSSSSPGTTRRWSMSSSSSMSTPSPSTAAGIARPRGDQPARHRQVARQRLGGRSRLYQVHRHATGCLRRPRWPRRSRRPSSACASRPSTAASPRGSRHRPSRRSLAIKGVVAVQNDSLAQPLTDSSPAFIGATPSTRRSAAGRTPARASSSASSTPASGRSIPSFADQGNLPRPATQGRRDAAHVQLRRQPADAGR